MSTTPLSGWMLGVCSNRLHLFEAHCTEYYYPIHTTVYYSTSLAVSNLLFSFFFCLHSRAVFAAVCRACRCPSLVLNQSFYRFLRSPRLVCFSLHTTYFISFLQSLQIGSTGTFLAHCFAFPPCLLKAWTALHAARCTLHPVFFCFTVLYAVCLVPCQALPVCKGFCILVFWLPPSIVHSNFRSRMLVNFVWMISALFTTFSPTTTNSRVCLYTLSYVLPPPSLPRVSRCVRHRALHRRLKRQGKTKAILLIL